MAKNLDLSTEPDPEARPIVRIDGTEYRMYSGDEFTPNEYREVSRLGAEMAGQQDADTVFSALEQLVDRIMVDLPVEVREKLSIGHLRAIVEVFLSRETDDDAASPANGSGSSPASNASTEGASATG